MVDQYVLSEMAVISEIIFWTNPYKNYTRIAVSGLSDLFGELRVDARQ